MNKNHIIIKSLLFLFSVCTCLGLYGCHNVDNVEIINEMQELLDQQCDYEDISFRQTQITKDYEKTIDNDSLWKKYLKDMFIWVGGFGYSFDTNEKTETKFLLAFTPWGNELKNKQKNKDSIDNLVFNYAAGDESAYYWNQGQNAGSPLVAIYSTHSAETYTSYSGKSSVSGQRGGVYVASSVVAETLAKDNIGVIVDDTIHDYPDWSKSYENSLSTARRLLNENQSVKIIIDMHRDAGISKNSTTTEINGKKAAKIMLVVGSNQRYEHPYWQQNLAFAQEIGDKMQKMYPGLLRDVKVQSGRYNQHISTHSILVEMGSTENTIEEVEYSSVLLSHVLESVLTDMKK